MHPKFDSRKFFAPRFPAQPRQTPAQPRPPAQPRLTPPLAKPPARVGLLVGLLVLLLAPLFFGFHSVLTNLNPLTPAPQASAAEVAQASSSTSTSTPTPTEEIKGQLRVVMDEQRLPVAGAQITVRQNGAEIGRAVSDSSGRWLIPVPGPGSYEVEIDPTTLPDGVGLTDPNKQILADITVNDGQSKTVVFRLGEGVTSTVTRQERIANLVFSGLRFGSILALCSVGLSLVYGVSGLVNFAHGEVVTLGALVAFYINSVEGGPGLNLAIAAVLAMLITGILSGGLEIGFWRPLRERKTSLVSLSLVTIGLSFMLRYIYAVIFGTNFRSYRDYNIQDPVQIGWVTTTPKNLIIVLVSISLLAALGLFLMNTQAGIGIRAVSANRELASVAGIDVSNVLLTVWLIGAGLSALGGVFYGISEQLDWLMGFRLLLLMFAAVILGGIGTAFGAMLGGFLVGLIVEVSTYWVDSEFKLVIALAVLIAMLLVRPQGLLGQRERTA